jgi:hypothetical protein
MSETGIASQADIQTLREMVDLRFCPDRHFVFAISAFTRGLLDANRPIQDCVFRLITDFGNGHL